MKVKWLLFLLCLIGWDLLSKQWALEHLSALSWKLGYPFGGVGVFSFGKVTCSLNFVTNAGAAWGLFANFPKLLFCVRFVVIGALLFFLALHHGKNLLSFPLYLIVSGALGNLVDYLLHGHVVDFLHFTFWNWSFPIFNFADAYISIGAVLLFWSLHKQSLAVKA